MASIAFNQQINSILKTLECRATAHDSSSIINLRNQLSIARSTIGADEIFNTAASYFFAHSANSTDPETIINHSIEAISSNKNVREFAIIFKKIYNTFTPAEKATMLAKVNALIQTFELQK